MKLRNLKNIDVKNKFVLLRDDFNVQIQDGKIMDSFRIDESMPTINKLRNAGAKIVICAHSGRPNGKVDAEFSLKPIADYLKVPLVQDCLDKSFMNDMKPGDVVLLENLRFYKGEEDNDSEFSAKLAQGFDLFVNDAFAVSHRAHASTVGVAKLIPSYAGELLLYEISALANVIKNPQRPLLAIIAGSKISSKINVLRTFVKLADKIIVGGALAITFIYALGGKTGNSLYEPDMKDTALDILKLAKENNCEILLPIDKGVGKEFKKETQRFNKTFDELLEDDIIMDEGILTTKRNIEVLDTVKTVIWNGSVGLAEWAPVWSYGTFALATEIAKRKGTLKSIVGGGDTVAALEATGTKDDMTYVSTGGGSFLEFIEGKKLPGLEVLKEQIILNNRTK